MTIAHAFVQSGPLVFCRLPLQTFHTPEGGASPESSYGISYGSPSSRVAAGSTSRDGSSCRCTESSSCARFTSSECNCGLSPVVHASPCSSAWTRALLVFRRRKKSNSPSRINPRPITPPTAGPAIQAVLLLGPGWELGSGWGVSRMPYQNAGA